MGRRINRNIDRKTRGIKMKLLLLNGSPRTEKSNTIRLTNAFLEGIKQSKNIQIDQVDLYSSSFEINYCIGCFSCWTKTPGKCVFNDAMPTLLEKIKESDIILWSFPLYYFDLPSKMKAFMDRMLPLNLPFMRDDQAGHIQRYDLSHQKQIVITSGGLSTVEDNFEAVEKHFELMTANYKDTLTTICIAQSPLLSVPELKAQTDSLLKKCKDAGQEYATSFTLSLETKRTLQQPLFSVDIYNKMADTSWEIADENKNISKNKNSLLSFTKQMALMYSPQSYQKDIVLEIEYTDENECYQILLKKDKAYVIENDFQKYTTKIETPFSVWSAISRGERSGSEALMNGDYRVLGDLSIMMQWDTLFGAGIASSQLNQEISTSKEPLRTSMKMMLIPLISMWVGLAINMRYGALATLMITALLPIIFSKIKLTLYDKIGAGTAILFSALALLGISYDIILPVSYAIFAIMWLGSLLTKIPLSAHYSNVDFGGEEAFKNPIFMRTNKILSAAWGVLYVLITGLSIVFIQVQIDPILIAIINNVAPILMGIFTNWFKNWYPKHLMQSK